MKTQESVLKQRISRTLILFIILGICPSAHGYSSVAPLENEAGPPECLIFEPRIALNSGPDAQTELLLNLNAALTSELSVYGRYSLQNDQRLGSSFKLIQNATFELSAQVEGTLSSTANDPSADSGTSSFGITAGVFAKSPLTLKGLPHLQVELGLALANQITTQTTTIPYALSLMHSGERGWMYGLGILGEASPSDEQSWNAFYGTAGYQTASALQYRLNLSAPLTETSAHQELTLSFGMMVPFGGGGGEADPSPKIRTHREASASSETLPHYNLNAEIVSMNEALFLIKIDKGSSDSIEKGQTFDIYSDEQLMARAQVMSVKKDEAALNVIEYKQEHWIELGFSARRLGE